MQYADGHCSRHWMFLACILLALPSCGRSQEAKVIAAIQAKYPDGKPRCLALGDAVGIHVPVQFGETLWYPANGPTSPLVHLFVFWAGRSSTPVPELVADLVERGILAKVTVQATVDAETTHPGPQQVSNGFYSHPTIYEHRRGSFAVDIYTTTKPSREDFDYSRQMHLGPSLVSTTSFPSRLYGDGPLPPPDSHYVIHTIEPYATSVVTSGCFRETIDRVEDIRVKNNLLGGQYMEADVLFDEHPPEWMLTRAFQRAAMGPNTDSITKPRLATIVFNADGGKMSYVREQWK